MDTAELDIVYFVKESATNEELRYSVRSVAKNLPHKRIWIFGGCPQVLTPDVRVRVTQVGRTKWDRVRAMFEMACKNKEITENFVLFNDDFFVMQPIDKIEPLYRCSLEDHIRLLEATHQNKPYEYSTLLRNCRTELARLKKPQLSYELHVPFIFNKGKLLKLLEKYPDLHCTRTFYGNFYNIGGEQTNDVKIFNSNPSFDYKNSRYLSTDDGIISVNSDLWWYIKKQLNEKSEYEEY